MPYNGIKKKKVLNSWSHHYNKIHQLQKQTQILSEIFFVFQYFLVVLRKPSGRVLWHNAVLQTAVLVVMLRCQSLLQRKCNTNFVFLFGDIFLLLLVLGSVVVCLKTFNIMLVLSSSSVRAQQKRITTTTTALATPTTTKQQYILNVVDKGKSV